MSKGTGARRSHGPVTIGAQARSPRERLRFPRQWARLNRVDFPPDRSVIDALSWRLASELLRRHPHDLWLNRGHPGGGLYDCLMIGSGSGLPKLMLNREGTIQVHGRFGGGESDWRPASWEQYLRADPAAFLLALEAAAGLPTSSPAASSRPVLVYRVFAVLSALTSKHPDPYVFEQAYIDSSGDDDGPNDAIAAFPAAAAELAKARLVEPRSEPGFDYWMVFRRGEPQWVFERSRARVWTHKGSKPADLMKLYDRSGRDVHITVFALLRSLSTALSSAAATESDALFG